MRLHYCVWTTLSAKRANCVVILHTCEALARLNPNWKIDLRCVDYEQDPRAMMAAMSLTVPANLTLGYLFAFEEERAEKREIKEMLAQQPSRDALARRKQWQGLWERELRRNPAVIYTRNIGLVNFFHEIEGLNAPILLELHQLKHHYLSNTLHTLGTLGNLKTALRASRDSEIQDIEKARTVFCISDSMRRRLQSLGLKIPAEVLPSGVNLGKLGERNGHSPRDIDLLYVGQLYVWKGVPIVIEALRHCPPEVRLTIVGGNNSADLTIAKQLAANLGVADRIDWIGQVSHDEALRYQRRAKIAVIPLSRHHRISKWFTSPVKIFELMASGAALLVSDLPSMRAIVEQGRTAEFAEPDNPGDWGGKIAELLANPDYREGLAEQAHQTIEEYSFERRASRISRIMTQTLAAVPS